MVNKAVKLKESDMLFELDKIVESNRLSYTECCFEKVDGIEIEVGKKPIGHPP